MRVRVSELDQVRWYRLLDSMTAKELAERLRGQIEPSRAMSAGTAWHAVLENPPADKIDTIESDGFLFSVECDAEITLPQIREIRAEKVFVVDGVVVTLSGGCDGISGNVVTDHKLTAKPDAEKYFGSYQWPAYLDIYNADVFEYLLYHAKDEGDVIRIRDVSSLRLYRYPGMRDYLIGGIRDFVDFCRVHVPERFDAPDCVPGISDIAEGIQEIQA